MEYLPGAASLAATNRSKIKHIRLSTLKETQPAADPRSVIMSFEKDTESCDRSMKDKVEGSSKIHTIKMCVNASFVLGNNLENYSRIGHPYVRRYGIGETFTWVMVMNPLMSEVFSISDCIEVDVTYKSCYELPYLFNTVAFNYLTMRCMLVTCITCKVSFLRRDDCWSSALESS